MFMCCRFLYFKFASAAAFATIVVDILIQMREYKFISTMLFLCVYLDVQTNEKISIY